MPPRERLSAEDWARAAVEALGRGGLAAVAVEPLATRLGATKGSFYWHFASRDALVDAALELWERAHTDAVIADLDRLADPRERLRALAGHTLDHAGGGDPVVSLLRDVDDPRVVRVLAAVTRRRVEYVRALLVELGVPPAEAGRRATLAYAAYVGWWQVRAVAPELAPAGEASERHARVLLEVLLPGDRPGAWADADRPG
ncbi:TetR/AcrR family transcriptional regulator [Geodermatophilus sp. SYSU D00696]